jgi:16S rRNA (adenine1518-N6/adenine1519-N6)-dimethyltransferase
MSPCNGDAAQSAARWRSVKAMSTRRRALGQHFLRDPQTARAIVDLVAPSPADLVVEIGPGRGALTGELATRAGRVLALEVDRDLVGRLRERFPAVEVLQADARTFDYTALGPPPAASAATPPAPAAAAAPSPGGRVLVVGNLPYSVGKPILLALVAAGRAIDEMALMLQREVAERVAAAPGGRTYGSLSVLTQAACDVRVAFTVAPGAFRPPPKVESAVLHLRVLPEPRVPAEHARRFRAVVRAAFAQRRKTLANALAGSLGHPVDHVRRILEDVRIDPARRAETLTIPEFVRLTPRL